MNWRGEQFIEAVRRRLGANIREACGMLRDEMKRSVSTAYPPASAPGESPHRRSGELMNRITSDYDDEATKGMAGAAGAVPWWLETGTRRMAARPFARPALMNNLNRVREIATRGIGRNA